MRVSRIVRRPPVASTKRRVSVAMPDRCCRKFSAVRSAGQQRARPARRDPRGRRPARHRCPSSHARREHHAAIDLGKHSARHVQSGHDAVALGDETARSRPCSAGTSTSVVTSPDPTSSARACRTRSQVQARDRAGSWRRRRADGWSELHRELRTERHLGGRGIVARQHIVGRCAASRLARPPAAAASGPARRTTNLRSDRSRRMTAVTSRPARARPQRRASAAPPICARISGLGRPRRAMHGSLAPPRPHFLGHERHERREQPQHHRQRGQARRRRRRRVVAIGRPPPLHVLDVVVAEPPEERLGFAERRRVVVLVEAVRRGPHQLRPAASACRDRARA